MSNKIIQSLWIGTALSNSELLCITSFIYHHHEFHLYTYDKIVNLPDGVVVKDANEILPADRLFKDTYESYTSFADWFRLKLLFEKGGWWVDMDVVCLKPIDLQQEICFSSEWNHVTEGKAISNTCVKAPAGAACIGGLLGIIEERLLRKEPIVWGELSVFLFRSEGALMEEVKSYMVEPAVFCPVNYFELPKLLSGEPIVQQPETLAVHLWNELWRRRGLDKNAVYHPDSLFEQLKKKYLPAVTVQQDAF